MVSRLPEPAAATDAQPSFVSRSTPEKRFHAEITTSLEDSQPTIRKQFTNNYSQVVFVLSESSARLLLAVHSLAHSLVHSLVRSSERRAGGGGAARTAAAFSPELPAH